MGALTLLLLTVVPLEIEPWGLTLAARGEVLEVTAVKAGGPAAHVGSQLARILVPLPRRPKAIGQLDAD